MSAYIVSDDMLDLLVSALVAWDSPTANNDPQTIILEQWESDPACSSDFAVQELSNGKRAVNFGFADAQYIKNELLAQNIASIKARYGSTDGFLADHKPFSVIKRNEVTIHELAGAIQCYDYQACENKEWKTSFAHALCETLCEGIVSRVAQGNFHYSRVQK